MTDGSAIILNFPKLLGQNGKESFLLIPLAHLVLSLTPSRVAFLPTAPSQPPPHPSSSSSPVAFLLIFFPSLPTAPSQQAAAQSHFSRQQVREDEDWWNVMRSTGTLLLAFVLGSVATMVGTLVAFLMVPMRSLGPDNWKIAFALMGSYIGGYVSMQMESNYDRKPPVVETATALATSL
ncbi:uncharacterized protein [Pyrus communis]|uniref:uncharacterized protein n=1 Tax=Pyrus communis TaxID=23211 RepID=UPI0035C0D602